MDAIARGFALVHLPRMPELKGVNVPFDALDIDPSTYVHHFDEINRSLGEFYTKSIKKQISLRLCFESLYVML